MECNEILRQGVLSTIITDTEKSVSENLYEWLRRTGAAELRRLRKEGLKIGLPYEGADGKPRDIDYDAEITEDELTKWKKSSVSENPREFTERESLYIIKNSLSEKAVQAWQASLGERRGLGGGLTYSVDGDRAGGVFIFSVYWTPGSLDDEPPEVLEGGFSVSGASFHQAIPDSARIPVSGFSVILHRDVRSGISIELKTSQGAISAAVPAIELSPAVSSSYSLVVIRTGNKYEARISSKRADQENISSAVYKIGLRKRITGSNLPVVLVPLTRVMTDRDPESQFSVVFKHERVPWIVADVNTKDGRTFTYIWEG